ncbi:ZrgA family zinc uptake protein [Oceanicaulis sp.]|uniref:ZrgA family zinc uptake protein n=1 Tax=Oceanicaulis sp. TaxID=1924941 RepID=UPI003BA90E03
MRLGIACLTACFLASPALAQNAEPMRQLGAHVHGAAQLAIAADPEGAVLAELTTPAFNLYVFEHTPETPEERAVVEQAARTLASASMITLSSAAQCTLTGTQVGGGPADASDDHHDHDHDHHHDHEHEHEYGHAHDADHEHMHHDGSAHHEHHDDHDHHDHGDHHDHNDHAGHGHADVVVSWTFECARPERLSDVDLSGLFEAFNQFETLEVQYFDGARAAAQDLTPARSVLRLD